MKVQKVNFKNFKKIENLHSELDGKSVFVLGGNNKGKTSFIQGIWNVLTGKDIPSEPVTQGAKKGAIEVDLGDYRAVLKMGKTNKLEVYRNGEKEPLTSPRSILNSMVGTIDFDPHHFFTLSSNKQVEYFCKVMGLDFAEIDDQYKSLYDSRTYDKKKLKELEAKFQPYDKDLIQGEDLDLPALIEKKKEADEYNESYQKVIDGVCKAKQELDDVHKEIKALEDKADKLFFSIENGETWLEENDPESTEEIEKQIEQYDKVKEARKMVDIEKEMISTENMIDEATQEMEDLKDQKKITISDSLDIDGLTYDGDIFLLNGLPFDDKQINTASQIITGLKMGLFMLKDIRIMRFDGSLLDEENLKIVDEWAKENDVQLFVERVDYEGGDLTLLVGEE